MTSPPHPEGDRPLSRDDVRQIVEDCVAAQVAPLSDYVEAMGMALARLVDQSAQVEPTGPRADAGPSPTVNCAAAGLTPALLAMTEGIRAVHDSVLALDQRLVVPLEQGGPRADGPTETNPEQGLL